MDQDATQSLLDAQRLEQDLALRRRDFDVAGHEVGEPAGLVHPGEDLLHDLVGQSRLLAQLGGPDSGLPMERDKGRIFRIERQHFLRLANDGLEVAVLFAVVNRDAPALAVQQELHAGEPALELSDAGDGSDGVEHLGGHILDVLPLRDREDQPVRRRQCGFDGPQRGRAPSPDRRGHAREKDDLAQRKHGQCQSFSHSVLLLPSPRLRGKNDRLPSERPSALHPLCHVSSRVRRLSHNNLRLSCPVPVRSGGELRLSRHRMADSLVLAAKLAARERLRLPGASRAYRLSAMSDRLHRE